MAANQMLAVVGIVFALGQPAAAQAPRCDITGEVHPLLQPALCAMGESIHAGDPPSNPLTIVTSDGDVVAGIRLGLPDAETLLLTLLNSWMTARQADIASVHVFYDRSGCNAPRSFERCEFLATAMTRGHGPPSVTFHHPLSR